jgi:transposase-like protein
MNPPVVFCPNEWCRDRGRTEAGNVRVHSRKEKRYRCLTCGKTFTETKGTPLYGLRHDQELVVAVLILLSHGCPVPAIVAAFGLDERTVASWQGRAGEHCRKIHKQCVEQGKVELEHVQADEMWVKLVKRRVWMAMAMAVPSRLWLGGVVSEQRDLRLILRLVQGIRACACSVALLVCVDGLISYVTAFRRVFRHAVYTGKRGRPRLVMETGLLLGQVVKQYAGRRMVSTSQRAVLGSGEQILAVLQRTGGGTQINTAYIERLNATFRGSLAALTRRGRRLVHKEARLTSAMYLVGCAYNFCWYHESLRLPTSAGAGRRWRERTPAMAAGLADRCWGMRDLLGFRIPPPPWSPPRRGRPRPEHPPRRVDV